MSQFLEALFATAAHAASAGLHGVNQKPQKGKGKHKGPACTPCAANARVLAVKAQFGPSK